jgi:phenylpropionate dioxygenase-like ring-hydroxylating dioxygenase large terminal subunit
VQTSATFDEDKEMLQAQQASLGEQGGVAFPVALRTDAGPIQARRLLEKMMISESTR